MTDRVAHLPTTDRDEAIAAVREIHAAGDAGTLYSHQGRYLALNLELPVADVADSLFDLGLDSDDASDEALRLVKRGF